MLKRVAVNGTNLTSTVTFYCFYLFIYLLTKVISGAPQSKGVVKRTCRYGGVTVIMAYQTQMIYQMEQANTWANDDLPHAPKIIYHLQQSHNGKSPYFATRR